MCEYVNHDGVTVLWTSDTWSRHLLSRFQVCQKLLLLFLDGWLYHWYQSFVLCIFPDCFDDDDDMQQYKAIKKGMMVGLFVEDYWPNVCPQIGCVEDVSLNDEVITVHWYSCSWTGPCKERSTGVGANRRKVTEMLDIRCCILWDFSLTSKRKTLKDITVQKLKAAYRELGLDV